MHNLQKLVFKNNKLVLVNHSLMTPFEKEIKPEPEPDGEGTVEIFGVTYKTVTLNGQTWLGENLKVETEKSLVNETWPEFGRYYSWDDAMSVANSIPGWHLPTTKEWETLVENAGNDTLRLCSKSMWAMKNGTDNYGMNIMPAGHYDETEFTNVNWLCYYWTADEKDKYFSNGVVFQQTESLNTYYGPKYKETVIRLVKD